MVQSGRNGRFIRLLVGMSVGIAGAFVVLSSAWAQLQPSEIFRQDLGRIGLNTLAMAMPSLVYRPIDDMSVRPGGAPQGMGGAYLAHAQGTLAVGWEPAGLAALERPSLVVDAYSLGASSATRDFPDSFLVPDQAPLVTTSYKMNLKGGMRTRFLAGGVPIWKSGGMRVAGAFSWRRYAEIIVPQTVVSDLAFGRERSFPVTLSMDIAERGAIEAFAPSFAVQVNPMISFGTNLNFLRGRIRAKNLRRISAGGFPVDARAEISFKYSGFVPDLGVRFVPIQDRFEVAGRYTPGYTLKVRGGDLAAHSFISPGQPLYITTARVPGYDLDIPAAMGLGVAFRATDRLWITSDWNQHNWEDTKLSYTQEPQDSASIESSALPYRNVSSIHLGAEYLLHRWKWAELPVRVGFHTSPQGYADLDRRDVVVDSSQAPTLLVTHSGTYHGKQVKATAYSAGASLRTHGVDYDFGFETMRYKINTWYLDTPWDLVENPNMIILHVKRSVTKLHLSASYTF